MLKLFRCVANRDVNLRLWKEGKIDVLFITGLSGGGKSTIAKKLAKEFGAKYVTLDGYYYRLLSEREGKSKKEIDLKKVGFEKGIQYILEDHPNERLVIEGGQVRWFNPSELKQHAVLFIGTSFMTSTWRAICRDFEWEHFKEYRAIEPWVHWKYNVISYEMLKQLMKDIFKS